MTEENRPVVPPLSTSAVARLERRIFAALDEEESQPAPVPPERPSWWRWSLVLVPVACLAVFIGVRLQAERADRALRGARIATSETGSHVTLLGAAVDLAPRSAIAIGGEPDGTTVLMLERGMVTCQVAPRAHESPFVVQAGATRVTVVGTRFTVERRGEHAAVHVQHGVVEVGDDGMKRVLRAGESYQPGESAQPASASNADIGATTPPSRSDSTPSPGGAEAPASPAVPAPSLSAASDQESAERRRSRGAGPASAPARRIAGSSFADESGPRAREAAPAAAEAPPLAPPAPPGPPPSPPAPPAPPPSLQDRFEAARRLETSDPATALRTYEELSRGTDAWAANALFAAGRLEVERGEKDQARALLETYLRRFPQGHNADDARLLLARLR